MNVNVDTAILQYLIDKVVSVSVFTIYAPVLTITLGTECVSVSCYDG